MPNAVVENPSNGHAHAVWALSAPFARTEYAKRKPLAYATAITEGLRRSVDGDRVYSRLLTKNPEHTAWNSHWITDHLYSLNELAFWLDEHGHLPPQSWKRTHRKSPAGLRRAIQTTAQTMNQEQFAIPSPSPKSTKSPDPSTNGSLPNPASHTYPSQSWFQMLE